MILERKLISRGKKKYLIEMFDSYYGTERIVYIFCYRESPLGDVVFNLTGVKDKTYDKLRYINFSKEIVREADMLSVYVKFNKIVSMFRDDKIYGNNES